MLHPRAVGLAVVQQATGAGEPLPGLRLPRVVVAVGVRQFLVEVEDGDVVVDEIQPGIRQPVQAPGADPVVAGLDLVAEHPGLRGEPGAPAEQVHHRRKDDHGRERGDAVPDEGPRQRTLDTEPTTPPPVDTDDGKSEEGDVVQPGPLHGQCTTEGETRGEPPPAVSGPRARRTVGDPALGEDPPERGLHLAVVPDKQVGGENDEEGLELVQHRRATGDEEDAVAQGEQARGQPHPVAVAGGGRQTPRGRRGEQDDTDAQQGDGDPPPDRGVAEDPHPQRLELLGEWGMDDQAVGGVVLDTAGETATEDLPGLRDVVFLVEDRGALIGGVPEFRQPGDRAEHSEHGENHRPPGRPDPGNGDGRFHRAPS